MPTCYMLIGAPGSGKSTWINKFRAGEGKNYISISTDDFIEAMAKAQGKTYGEVFKDCIGAATTTMEHQLEVAVRNEANLVWDQTNMSVKGRRGKLAKLKGYKVIAVTFELGREELDRRNAKRKAETGKFIAPHIVDSMLSNYEAPTEAEGFAEIITIKE